MGNNRPDIVVPPNIANGPPEVLERMMISMIGRMIKEFPDPILVEIADMILDEQVRRNHNAPQ